MPSTRRKFRQLSLGRDWNSKSLFVGSIFP
jgi:hypothetical protein